MEETETEILLNNTKHGHQIDLFINSKVVNHKKKRRNTAKGY